ncbi:MAG: hypothetical protein WB660_31335 [Candidatus Sulfotelmatobacter sp.]
MATLIVEEISVPFVLNKLGYDYDNVACGIIFRQIENELNDGNDDEAVGGRQDVELGRLLARGAERFLDAVFPFILKQYGILAGLDVQPDYFRRESRGKINSLPGNAVPPVDSNDRNRRLAQTRNVNGYLADGVHSYPVVVAANKNK